MTYACPFIEISGRPFERGVAYGSQAKPYIARGVRQYRGRLQALSMEWNTVQRIAHDFLRMIEEFGAHYADEMRGIAQGAELSIEEIVLLNARTEIVELALRPERLQRFGDTSLIDGCTTVVAQPEATSTGRLIHAHNWDWNVDSAFSSLVVRVRRDDGPDFITFTEAGQLARFGFNSAGIAVSANYLESDRDYEQVGVPLALIRRKVLEEAHLALAVKTVYTTPKSASNNIVLSDAHGLVMGFECAPDETFIMEAERGLYVHTNHWRSPIALTKLRDTGIESTPCSIQRDLRARQLLTPQVGRLTPETVKGALLDEFGAPWAICRPPRTSGPDHEWATLAMLIMEPAAGRLEVTMMPAVNRQVATFTLEMQQDAAAA